MLLMIGKGIRGGICHSVHKYAKVNNKEMKNHMYSDLNNQYGWGMSQKLPVNGFKRKKIILNLMKTT